MRRVIGYGLVGWMAVAAAFSADDGRDFTGNWVLDAGGSNTRALGAQPEVTLKVAQDARAVHCWAEIGGRTVVWSYDLNGGESRYRVGEESRNSVAKWEGAALLINTLISGPQNSNYTVMDRWRLERDASQLAVTRQIVRAGGEVEGTLVYRRAGAAPPVATSAVPPKPLDNAGWRQAELAPRPQPVASAAAADLLTVPAGTHILLRLVNSLNTRKSRDGDRVYLRTAVPIAISNHVVIPRGSDVAGTIVQSPPADKKAKGDLFIRFDSLTLPNGVTRDLLSRPDGGQEGKIASAGDQGGDARRTAQGGAIGAGVGGIAGAAAGHPITGLGIGAVAGAVAGMKGVFSKKPEPIMPQGSTMEMVLDRDLAYQRGELVF